MIKLKSFLVILFSSLVISLALILTLVISSLHLSWKEKGMARSHAVEISKLNTEFYGQFINIFDLQAKKGKKNMYKEKYLLEGVIKNAGFRTVGSIALKVDFLNASRQVIHTEVFKPLASSLPPSKTSIAALSIFMSGKELPLAPDTSLRFKHILSCQKNKNVVSPIRHQRFATNPSEWSGKLDYKISMIKF